MTQFLYVVILSLRLQQQERICPTFVAKQSHLAAINALYAENTFSGR